MNLLVSFRSQFLDMAITLFQEAFADVRFITSVNESQTSVHFEFTSDSHIRDLRSWVSDAMGCGLISMGSVQLSE